MAIIATPQQLRQIYPQPRERSLKKQLARLDPYARRFLELSPFCVLCTQSLDGRADASPKGDAPGFVRVEDDTHLLIPDWPGNNRLDSFSNLLSNPAVGLLFLVPGVDESLRVNGRGELRDDLELRQLFARGERLPLTVLRVEVEEVFLHCAKALMRSKLWSGEYRVERSLLPSMGEMIKAQTGSADPAETQEQMLERYHKTLY